MKKFITFLFVVFVVSLASSQNNLPVKKAKDSIKTEVVNVITSYSPKVTDAFKVKRNPNIRFNRNRTKEKMDYRIFSVPVASTFVPKSGTIKNIDLGKRERLYYNYLAVGFGNRIAPFAEAYINNSTRFDSHFGLYAKYHSSKDPVKNTQLNSSFSNIIANVFYKQEDHYFDWKIGLNTAFNSYNFYGLPSNITFNTPLINAIDEKQQHNFVEVLGELDFENSFIENIEAKGSYFFDNFKSSEYKISLEPKFIIPLEQISRNLNEVTLNTSIDYLGGSFNKNYINNTKLNYGFFTAKVHPKYSFTYNKLNVKLGTKMYVSYETEKSLTHFLMYPDVQISHPIVKNIANIYLGANGDLHTNSYKNFTDENPFTSPTLAITQTNEKYNLFGGLNGKLTQNLSYNTRVSYINEEDKPLFINNNSKSNGTVTNSNLLGYEYGNSFSVLYDDITTLRVFGELEYEYDKHLSFGTNAQFNSYTTTNQTHAWNLPKIAGEVFSKYKTDKWYAGVNFHFKSTRYDVNYNGIFPSTFTPIKLDDVLDLSLNGGYHFDDTLSAFLKLNNVLNNKYQNYRNFNVQGFQVLGGITWKFDF